MTKRLGIAKKKSQIKLPFAKIRRDIRRQSSDDGGTNRHDQWSLRMFISVPETLAKFSSQDHTLFSLQTDIWTSIAHPQGLLTPYQTEDISLELAAIKVQNTIEGKPSGYCLVGVKEMNRRSTLLKSRRLST